MTIEEIRARQEEIRGRLQEIDGEFDGRYLDPESDDGQEFERLNDEFEENQKTIDQLEARHARLEQIADRPENREEPREFSFQTARPGATRGEDIWDLSRSGRRSTRQAPTQMAVERAVTAPLRSGRSGALPRADSSVLADARGDAGADRDA
jgi:predicted nuclease with TOPRIM domain